ncbi:MAG: hypothetical protein ABW352_01735 [Polyangiales bacterium]
MRTIRFRHLPSGAHLLVGPERVHVATEQGFRDSLTSSWQGRTPEEWQRAGAAFEALWLWPAPGTRGGSDGELAFEGYLDAREARRLATGEWVPARRTPLEQHLTAFDYQLKGELGFLDLYRAFRGSLFPWHKAALKALGALLVFGRGRPVVIADIAKHRAAARTGGYDAEGELDAQVLAQFDALFKASEEVEQARLRRFIAQNFQPGRVSTSQWESFFATCRALNDRETVTRRQLRRLFDGSFTQLSVSRADAAGKRMLEALIG